MIKICETKSVHIKSGPKKRAKRAKHLKIWAKIYKIWKYFEKRKPHVCDYRMHETARICPASKSFVYRQCCWRHIYKIKSTDLRFVLWFVITRKKYISVSISIRPINFVSLSAQKFSQTYHFNVWLLNTYHLLVFPLRKFCDILKTICSLFNCIFLTEYLSAFQFSQLYRSP